MQFNIMGFDFYPNIDVYGFWIGNLRCEDYFHRSMFMFHSDQGYITIDLFLMRIKG